MWAGAQIKPGQYTGKKQLNALTREDHKTGIQAWARKVHTYEVKNNSCLCDHLYTLCVTQDMFQGLAPVLSGFGIKMMKKMGWSEGQPLGRMGKGVTEPIPMSVKVDRAG